MTRRAVVAAAVLGLGLGLAGCTAEQADPGPASSETGATPTPSGTASATPTPTPSGTADPATTGDQGGAPSDVLPTLAPVALDEAAAFGTGVSATLGAVRAVEVEGQGPGEVSGPALAFEVVVTNGTGAPVDLSTVTVALTDDSGAPGLPMSGAPASPFAGELAAGASATATYVFRGVQDGLALRLEVSYSTAAPVVVFAGTPALD